MNPERAFLPRHAPISSFLLLVPTQQTVSLLLLLVVHWDVLQERHNDVADEDNVSH